MDDKIKLQEYYDVLSEIKGKYDLAEYNNNKGKNKAIRNEGLEEMETIISEFKIYVTSKQDLYSFLTGDGDKDTLDYGRYIIWDELTSIKYFSRDLSRRLNEIQKMLNR